MKLTGGVWTANDLLADSIVQWPVLILSFLNKTLAMSIVKQLT